MSDIEVEFRAVYEHPDGELTLQPIPPFLTQPYRESGWRIERRTLGPWEATSD